MKTALKVLIVDDDPDASALLIHHLQKLTLWEVTCATCQTGEEALLKIKEQQPEMVFMDYVLKNETGTDVIRSLKETGSNAAFILLTGEDGADVVVEALRAGANDYLRKQKLSPESLERSIRHIIERRKIEEALRKSEEILKKAQEIAHLGSWDWNLVTGELAWTDEIYRIFGLKPQEFDATYEAFLKTLHPEDRDSVIKAVNEAVEHKTEYNVEHRIIRPDGTVRTIQERGEVYYDKNGKPLRMIGTVQDLTERVKAIDELRKSEESLKKAQEIAHLGSWDWNILDNKLTWSDEIYRIFGIDRQIAATSYNAFLRGVHPDDREMVVKAVDGALFEKKVFNIEHRIVRPDGSVRIVHEIGEVYLGSEQNAERMIGTVQDITERKKAEENLRMASKVIENASEGVVVTDRRAVIQSVNPAIIEITGYSREDLIGKKPSIWKSDHQDRDFYLNMWSSLLETGRWEGEIWNRRKNGEAFPARLTISAIKDPSGVTTQYASIMHDMTEIKESRKEIEHRAYHDALTGLPNRQLFLDRLEQAIGRSKKSEQIFAVLFIGLDNFKNINDSMGHAAGDDVLIEVASRLISGSREIDTISRLSGDEFAIIVENIELEQEVGIITLRYKELFAKPFLHNGEELFITVSIGIALYPANGKTAEEILKNADMAMYQVKLRGKDDLFYFTESLNEKVQKRTRLEKNLRRAISNDEFVVYYQPKVNIQSGEIVGMEALVRWIQPDGTLVSPGDFIPVAEETGLIIPIGDMVMKKACLQTFKWNKSGYPNLRVAVNLSVKQFQQKTVNSTVEAALKETGLDPSLLEVEITESMVMQDMESAIETMNALRDRGISISIDDFGTGYSSLAYLKRFPIHALKIDQSFISDVTTNSDDAAIALAIISLAKSLGLKVIAEGVETNDQLDFLRKNNCDEMQGYLFSKPLPEKEFEELIKSGKTLHGQAVR